MQSKTTNKQKIQLPSFLLIHFRDIVKLTAQFVARNGRQFLTQLMNREQRNFQFDFLRPQHSLFQYFTKLLEQYTKVLIPPKSMQQRLRDEAKSAQAVLEQAKYRAEWQRYQEAQRAKEEEILERERGLCSRFFSLELVFGLFQSFVGFLENSTVL